MSADIKVKGPLKFPGYEQTAEAGANEQVLTYRDGNAEWSDGSVSLPRQLPCFFVFSTLPIFTTVPAPIYRIDNTILCRDYIKPVDDAYSSNAIKLINNALPCRVYDSNTNTYTNSNIQLR